MIQYIDVYKGLLLTHKEEWNNAPCNDIDGPWDYHIKWSKLEKDKYMVWLTCEILKKTYKWTYLQTGNRFINIKNKLMVTNNGTPFQYSSLENPMDGGAC